MKSSSGLFATLCLLLTLLPVIEAHADGCPQATEDIATDRPDVTNSSIVVPVGSLQNENGVNISVRSGSQSVDGTNSRWRLGVAPCLEILVDLPNYVTTVRGLGVSGFGDVSPALKWQISPAPGKIDLSITTGLGFPTGAVAVAGAGTQPYVQMPWSWELHDGWGLSGMFTEFFHPEDFGPKTITETTFVVEKKLTERFSIFTEYVGDYPQGASPSHLWNSGGSFHLTKTQQIDFHVALGLNRNSPSYIVGLGYSFRVDGLFR
jgi:Putative MetA-pathway of phenol degradation